MNADSTCDVAVLGGGAAGLTAAIFAAREDARVTVLDGASRIGAKILIAGGGRCNVTHHVVAPEDFNATNRNLLARVLRSFGVDATIRFFAEIGVELKTEETGKLFPVTDRASTVLDALLGESERAGVAIRIGARVEKVDRQRDDTFAIDHASGTLVARRIILATGGRSVPKTGSDGQGYELARLLGHSIVPTFPALVPLLMDEGHWMKPLKGISTDVDLVLTVANGRVVRRSRGSMLFAHFGVTGPVVLDMSRHWIASRSSGEKPELSVSFLPGESFESVDAWLRHEAAVRPRTSIVNLLRMRLAERLADAVVEQEAGVDPATMLGQLSKPSRRALVHALVETPLPVTGDRGFAVAEVTAGGIPLTEIDVSTMESKCCRGLHLCGEILDVDGRIGGFNFQWAWASGRLAGLGAARRPS